MPDISVRGRNMPPSPIRKLVPYAEEAKKRGIRVLHLNIGQPDIKTPKIVLDAIRCHSLDIIEYTHSAGNISYRKGLTEYYRKHHVELNEEQILITTGGSEAILFAFFTCMNPGDEVIIPEPFYANYNGFAQTAGVTIVPITSTIETGFALPDISRFEALITPRTKAILICNPSNPTGYLYSEDEIKKLIDLVQRKNLFLIADEVYREFIYDGRTHHSILSFEGVDDHAIVVDSISKRYSMCGARVGAMLCRNRKVIQTALKYAQARLSPPTLGQLAGEAALKTDENYFREVIHEYIQRRNVLVEGLNSIEGVICPTPGGAFYTVAQLPIDDADNFCQWMLESFEHKGKTVMMAPASGFYATPGLGKNQVRLAYVLNISDLQEAVECLRIALPLYPGYTLTRKNKQEHF